MTPRPLRTRPWLVALALMLPALAAQAQGGAAPGCDPSRQSCAPQASAPSSTPALPGSAASPVAGGACRPGDAGATCGGAGPASQGNSSGTNNGAGNPINVINGNKYQIEVDLAALPGELGLELVRHYNSANARVIGALGAGWRLSYETELYVIGQSIQVLQADGTRLIFAIDAANPSHCTSADPVAGHIEIGQRRSARGQRQRHYIWHWTHGPDAGRKLHFDAAGKLEQIVAASGAALTIQRGPAGELLQVTDPQGRSLRLNWASKSDVARARAQRSGGYFAGIQSIDTPLGRFIYRHGGAARDGAASAADAADAARERAQAANLTEVAIPTHVQASQGAHPWANRASSSSSVRRLYHYEDARWPQMLTGISVQGAGSDGQQISERLATYGYDARGRAILSVRGPADASAPGLEQVSLQYLEPALPTRAGRTLLTNGLGEQTLYTHRIIGGEYRLLEARGAGCAQCGPVNMRYDYDALGRMNGWQRLAPTRIEAGREPPPAQVVASHRLTLDAQGNTVASDAAGTPEQAEYGDARWPDKPTLLTRASVVAGRQHQIELTYNEAGQITTLSERGWSPVNAKGEQEPTPIERATHYRYTRINGRSVLIEVDGPLANGPRGDPSDSDITRYSWDERGSFVTQVTSPGGFQSSLTHDRAGRLVKVRNDAGFATHWAWDARSQLIHLASSGPGWSQPQVQSHRYDALGRLTESARGARPTDAAAVDDAELGALLEAAGPYTAQQARGYDAAGRLAWQASALGLLQTRTHDSEGRLIESGRHSSAMAQVERWQYGPHGQIAAWSDAAGRYARIEFDAAGRPSAYRDSTGRRVALAPARPGQRAPGAAGTPEAAQPGAAQILQDDFGRTVASRGGQHGRQLLLWNEADQLVAMQDALGQRAAYRHDAAGRIAEQRITPADGTPAQVTRWHYRGRLLAAIEHPTQSEHYRYDARGLIASRSVTIAASAGQHAITATTRYRHDAQGRLAASSLPDGTWLHYERGGQGQVVALVRSPVQRRWLRKLAREQVIARDFQRDLVGLKGYSAGNGIQSQWQRDRHGTLARIVHRRRAASPRLLQAALTPATQRALDRMLGIAPAHAQAAPQTGAADAPADPQHPAPPGALGLPAEAGAFFDERYLWSSGGLLLHSQRPHGASGGTEARNWAYDASGQLIAGVQTRSRAAGAIPVADDAQETPATQVWRYAYRGQRRVLAQEAASQGETRAGTVRTAWDAQGRPRPDAAPGSDAIQHPSAAYDANGQPTRLGQRHYRWDALGRLAAIGDGRQPIAQYRYDHRGLRIAKQARGARTHYLYGAGRELVAELDGQGRLQRQYVYLADLLLAAIDTPASELAAPPAGDAASPASQQPSLWSELAALAASHLGSNGAIAHIHANHLGAPEAVSDSAGRLIWQASYAPFGMASIRSDQAPGPAKVSDRRGSAGYVLNIRLPGQYFDEESGLHYNRQRYYDPAQGAYLSPDPLGHPDGPNAYAYVANNPLGSVDPDGLILFAFDGTGNTDDQEWLQQAGGTTTNVVRFRDLYQSDSGKWHYVTGVGTDHAGRDNYGDIIAANHTGLRGRVPDRGGNYSGPARIERMLLYFIDAAEAFEDDDAPMDIDVVGFSRGAAQARDFANRLAREASKHGGDIIRYQKHNPDGSPRIENGEAVYGCQRVNFRFMGLFDTVLSVNRSGHAYSLGIPQQFGYVAQAVALNEYRSQPFGDLNVLQNGSFWDATRTHLPNDDHWGGFPLESIGASSRVPGKVRIELGFIGAHSDVGGGYGDNNGLSTVALAWMVGQAQIAGVRMDASGISIDMNNPVIHDQSNAIRVGDPLRTRQFRAPGTLWGTNTYTVEDRVVRRGLGGVTQRTQTFGSPEPGGNRSMTNADTHQFISYTPRPANVAEDARSSNDIAAIRDLQNRTGSVKMQDYMSWLRGHGYVFAGLGEW